MSAKQPSLRMGKWCMVLPVLAGFFFGGAAALRAATISQEAAEQEKDKKEEKKDEKKADKKDEKKGLPLKSDRKVEFTTDEGTWLSLDVSPDAKTIAFELIGDIYHAADRGRASQADLRRDVLRQPAEVFSGREMDCVRFRPRGQREHLDHASGRYGRETGLKGSEQ